MSDININLTAFGQGNGLVGIGWGCDNVGHDAGDAGFIGQQENIEVGAGDGGQQVENLDTSAGG